MLSANLYTIRNTAMRFFIKTSVVFGLVSSFFPASVRAAACSPADLKSGNVSCSIDSGGLQLGGGYNTIGTTGTVTLTGSIYQVGENGLVVQMAGNTPPVIKFEGGSLWNMATSYNDDVVGPLPNSLGMNVDFYKPSGPAIGDVAIHNGYFDGQIKIYRGDDKTQHIIPTSEGDLKIALSSKGNINLYGGKYYFHGDQSEILLKATTSESNAINLYDPLFNVGYVLNTDNPDDLSGTSPTNAAVGNTDHMLNIYGGTYNVGERSVLKFAGKSVLLENNANYQPVKFSGNGKIAFSSAGAEESSQDKIFINSGIYWNEGTLELAKGSMQLNAHVTVNRFRYDINTGSTLEISKGIRLTVLSNFEMSAQNRLIGAGELYLNERASAQFGSLNFGTIRVNEGNATFTGNSVLGNLYGGKGNLYISAPLSVGSLFLEKANLYINEGLNVTNMDFGTTGFIKFTADKSMTLRADTTIYNTKTIDTSASQGTITIASGYGLNFADGAQASGQAFVSQGLNLHIEEGSSLNFNGSNATVNDVTVKRGVANFNSGTTTFGKLLIGDAGATEENTNAVATVAAGANARGKSAEALIGARMIVNGNLTVDEMTTNGGRESYSTVSGTGTLTIAKSAQFNGRFADFNAVVLDSSVLDGNVTAVFNGTSGGDNIASLTLKSSQNGRATASLTGTLTLNSLNFDETYGGVVDIAAGATLGIRHTSDISGANATKNVIKGNGTLELLDATSINFGGSGEYLGGLKIGTGKATITQEATLGKVTFASLRGGTLDIINGVTLNILSDVITSGTNLITGAGTLKLVGNANGTFGASIANLGRLEIGNGTARFNYNSSLENVVFTTGGTGKVEIAKGIVITLSNSLNLAQTNAIVGEGMLRLAGAADAVLNTGTGSLGYLQIGSGTASFNKDSLLNNLSFSTAEGGALNIGNGLTLTINNSLSSAGTNEIGGQGTLVLNDGAVANFGASLNRLSNLTVKNATATFNADSRLQNFVFAGDSGILNVGNGVTVTLTQDLLTSRNNNITGSGTLQVGDDRTLTLGSSISGLANLQIGAGASAVFNKDGSVGSLSFTSTSRPSTLNIAAGQTLSVTNNVVVGDNNAIDGTGTLLLAGGASGVFGGLDYIEGTLKIGSGTASFIGDKTVASIAFVSGRGGTIDIAEGKTLSINTNISTSGSNLIAGAGTLTLKDGSNAKFDAAIPSLGALTVGSGRASFNANANIGKVSFGTVAGGEIALGAGRTLTVHSDFATSGSNTLSGEGTLVLADGVNADIGSLISSVGGVRIGSGSLNINENANIGNVAFSGNDGSVNIAAGKVLSVTSGFATNGNNVLAGAGTLALKGGAGATFNTALNFNGILTAESGTVRFNRAGSVGTMKIGTAGVLDLDVNRVNATTGDFGTGSTLALRIARHATDDNGVLRGSGFGVLQANTVNVSGPSTLKVTVDYGVVTKTNGTVFKVIEGTVNNGNAFSISNNRYRFEKTDCAGGLCYTVFQTANGADAAGDAGGSKNHQDTAGAILDGRFFADGSELAKIAEHLDYLSQHHPREYINALTALAPDVTGASVRLPLNMSGHVIDTLTRRMSALSPSMGMDYHYRRQNIYGRSGGSPYDYRWMPASDYFRQAGYRDDGWQSSPVKEKYRPRPRYKDASGRVVEPEDPHYRELSRPSRREDELRRRAKERQQQQTGLWAQTFYNASEFISSNDPKGFSGNTTGVAVGIDAQVWDGVIAGFGYAYTTTSADALQRETDITGNSLFLYSMYKPSNWYVSGVFNYSKLSSEETKDLSGIMMNDDYDSSSYAAQISAGYDFGWWKPSFGLRYASLSTDAHTDSVGQKIGSMSDKVATALLEARFSKDYVSEDGSSLWKPELRVGLSYDLSSDDNEAHVYLPNGSFYTVSNDALEKTAFEVGIGVTYMVNDKTDVYLGYNGEFRKDYTSHTGMLNFRYNF